MRILERKPGTDLTARWRCQDRRFGRKHDAMAYEFWRGRVENGIEEGLHDVFKSLKNDYNLLDDILFNRRKQLSDSRSNQRD